MREKELKRPLVLLVAAGRPEGKTRLSISQGERWAERGARPLTALEPVGVVRIQVQHLRARAQAESEAVDHGRALQPAPAGRAGDQVPVTVGDSNVDGIAARVADRLRTRSGPVAFRDRLAAKSRKSGPAAARRTR